MLIIDRIRLSPSTRHDSTAGNQLPRPPKSPTTAHTSSGGRSMSISASACPMDESFGRRRLRVQISRGQTRTTAEETDMAADGRSRTDEALDHAQDAVRASIEAAAKIARESMETGTEAAHKVQASLKEALEALRSSPK